MLIISNWNTINVISMKEMFSGCSSLKSLPDISKWKIDNVNDLSYMFFNCCSLGAIPNLLVWNIHKVKNLNYMFSKCSSLISFTDFSVWNIANVETFNNIIDNSSFSNNLSELYKIIFSNLNNNLDPISFKQSSSLENTNFLIKTYSKENNSNKSNLNENNSNLHFNNNSYSIYNVMDNDYFNNIYEKDEFYYENFYNQ